MPSTKNFIENFCSWLLEETFQGFQFWHVQVISGNIGQSHTKANLFNTTGYPNLSPSSSSTAYTIFQLCRLVFHSAHVLKLWLIQRTEVTLSPCGPSLWGSPPAAFIFFSLELINYCLMLLWYTQGLVIKDI